MTPALRSHGLNFMALVVALAIVAALSVVAHKVAPVLLHHFHYL